LPAGNPVTLNRPVSELVDETDTLLAGLETFTVAPEMAAPCWSNTVPVICPFCIWATAVRLRARTATTTKNRANTLVRFVITIPL
jgi:hypothetical protein